MKLFILFQGFGTTLSDWNNVPSKFLSRLKKIGHIYQYQNQIYNSAYYNKDDKDRFNFSSKLDNLTIDYLNAECHLNNQL
jgi:hypothetical protein